MLSQVERVADVLGSFAFIAGLLWAVFKIKVILDFNTKATLKLIITSDRMPMTERLDAYELYIKNGGNGAMKKYVEEEIFPQEVCRLRGHSNESQHSKNSL